MKSFLLPVYTGKFLPKTLTLFLLFLLAGWSTVKAQQQDILQKRISLNLGRVAISTALEAIEKETGYEFSYSSSLINADRSVNVTYENVTLSRVLQELLGDAALGARVEGRQIRIRPSAGKGSISGYVQASDGKAAAFVHISIKGLRNTVSDTEGHFAINNLEAGVYTLSASHVGLKTQNHQVKIAAGDILNVAFTLSEDTQTIEEIIVKGKRTNKFANKESTHVAKLPLDYLENPQVYSVVNSQLIREQALTDYEDAHRNIPGVMTMKYSGGATGIVMRGFLTNGRVKNGMDMIGIGPRDPVTIERIEAIKGPSGTLFGSLSTTYGGLVNYITKKPHEQPSAELSLTSGSWGLNRITADINTPINSEKGIFARINAAAHTENSFQDQGFDKSYIIAPVFTYQASPRLKITLETELIGRQTRSPYTLTFGPKVTAKNFKDLDWDYRRSLLGNGVNNKTSYTNVFTQAEYRISDSWTSQTAYAWSEGAYTLHHSSSLAWISDSTITRAFSVFSPDRSATTQIQQNFTGDFKIGSLRNRLVVGINYTGYYQYRTSSSSAIYDTVNINKPVVHIERRGLDGWAASKKWSSVRTLTNMYSVYASDVLNFTETLMIMLSLRLDRYRNEGNYNVATGKASEDFAQTAVSPKLGIVYQPLKERLSVFANYMNGFRNVAPIVQPDGTTSIFQPQLANQWEVGMKTDLMSGKLNATINYYNILVTNATRPEIRNNMTFTVQDGTQLSKGFEVDLAFNPIKGLNILAGYGYNDNRFTRAAANVEGKLSAATPQNLANLWLSYAAVNGLGFGIGGNYVADSYYDSNNTFILPSYTLLNSSVFYENVNYRISIKGNNLLNQLYWDTTGNPQKPANFLLALHYKF